MGKWLKRFGSLPYLVFVLFLAAIAAILVLGDLISERWADFHQNA
ncbi:MAG: hypothetical protein ACE5KJ_05345 [Candidatus Zixiibacteriota bacterium]